jgi:hypothetical protein
MMMALSKRQALTVGNIIMQTGTGIVQVGLRKWWNTVRWIRGPVYAKIVDPKESYKQEGS